MKLDGMDVVALKDGDEFSAMAACSDSFRTVGSNTRGIRVCKVEVRIRCDSFEQSRIFLTAKLVPSHVWQLHICRQGADFSRELFQTDKLGSFFARFVEGLQSETNAQKRNATLQRREQRSSKLLFIEGADECGEMSDAGQNQCACFIDLIRCICAGRFGAQPLQCAFDARHIACAVVDECDRCLHRRPFVLGRTLRRRLSRETAKLSARANALKSAST